MSVRTGDEDATYRTVGVDAAALERYADVSTESGEVIVYDRENENAWIQSSSVIGLEFMA